jgi:hypothetical protein
MQQCVEFIDNFVSVEDVTLLVGAPSGDDPGRLLWSENFLPRTSIPFDRFRSELGLMGFEETRRRYRDEDEFDFTDGTITLGASRTDFGFTLNSRGGGRQAEAALEVIGRHIGSDFVGDRDEEYYGAKENLHREHLDSLGVTGLVAHAEELLGRSHFHGDYYVRVCEGCTEHCEWMGSLEDLGRLEKVLGEKLLAGIEFGNSGVRPAALAIAVGRNLVEAFYEEMIREHEEAMDRVRRANRGETVPQGDDTDTDPAPGGPGRGF